MKAHDAEYGSRAEAMSRLGRWLIPHARTLVVLGFFLVVLAGVGAILLALRAGGTDALIAHTYQVRESAKNLLISLEDATASQRGFLLTGNEKYLERLRRSQIFIPATLQSLADLTADNPIQQERLRRMGPLAEEQIGLIRQTIALERDGRHDDALAIMRTDRGEELMASLRDALSKFMASELELLSDRQAHSAALRLWLLLFITFCLVAATTLAGLLARSTGYYLSRLRERTEELEAEERRRAQTEETLRQAQKLEAVGQLSGGIAHDFNNLLTIIIGNLDTLQRRTAAIGDNALAGHPGDFLSRPLDMALRGARSAAELTHRLLAYARRQPLKPERVALNHLVANMSDILRHTLGRAISVETDLAPGLWPTFADANLVESAILNLAINARDAMPDGGRLTIATANTYLDEAYVTPLGDVAPGPYVMLSVTDTGTGIAPDVMQKIFEPFFTTKPVGQGSGLGLPMVHGFVKQTGGHIRILSEPGHGTSVRIFLPRLSTTDEAAEAAPPADDGAAAATATERAQGTILLVEDNEGVRAFTRAALEEAGYRVVEAGDAEAALHALSGNPPFDLLFTDMVLPGGVSGRALADRIRKQHPTLPVLFTTGYAPDAIFRQGRQEAGIELLTKPYTQQELTRKIEATLKTARGVARR